MHEELRALLLKGSFDLKKWSPVVLDSIDPSLLETMPIQDLTNNDQSKYPKALGVEWDSTQDIMSASLSLPSHYTSTKRGIISDIARTFDILRWLTPTIVTMKVLYQRVWEEKLAWDDPLPQPYVQQHSKWRQELHLRSSITATLQSLPPDLLMGFVMPPSRPMLLSSMSGKSTLITLLLVP